MAVELDSVCGYSLIVNLVKRETKKKTKGHLDDSGDDACLGQKAKTFRQQSMTWSLGMEMLNAPNKRRIWNSGCRNFGVTGELKSQSKGGLQEVS